MKEKPEVTNIVAYGRTSRGFDHIQSGLMFKVCFATVEKLDCERKVVL